LIQQLRMRGRIRDREIIDGLHNADSEINRPDSICEASSEVRIVRLQQPPIKPPSRIRVVFGVPVIVGVCAIERAWGNVHTRFRTADTSSQFWADENFANSGKRLKRLVRSYQFSTSIQFLDDRR